MVSFFSFPLGVRPLRVDLVARWFCFFLCLDHCVGVGFGRLRPRVGGCVSYSNVGPRSVSLFLVFRVLAWFCLCMRWFRFITLRSARGVGFLRRKVQIRAVYYSCLDSVPRIPAVESGRPVDRPVVLVRSRSTPPIVIRATLKGASSYFSTLRHVFLASWNNNIPHVAPRWAYFPKHS